MFSPPPVFAQAQSKVVQESPDAMAAKRARTEAPVGSYKALDVSTLKVKIVEGKGSPLYLALVDQEEAQFILTPDGPNAVLRGFDVVGAKEKRSFNTGDTAAIGNYLSIYVTMDKEQAAFLQEATEKIRVEMKLEAEVEWKPLIPKNELYESSAVSIKVGLMGGDNVLTALKFKLNNVTTAGKGWDFLKDQATVAGQKHRSVAFNGAEVMVVSKLRPWMRDGKAGVELVATQLAIKVLERKFVDLLPDW